jgi:hypothetical protein
MIRPIGLALAAAASLGAAAPAAAQTVLLNDSFDTEHGGAGAAEYSGFANFIGANVDLLAPGYFGGVCEAAGGSTACVDMEGSGNGSLTTKSLYALAPGVVTMQFDLAGDQRSRAGNVVTASLVSNLGETLFSESFALASDTDFTHFTRSVTLAAGTSARLSFLSSGPADSMGMLLDNVILSAGGVAPPVPEPGSALLIATGLAGIGWVARRRNGAGAR